MNLIPSNYFTNQYMRTNPRKRAEPTPKVHWYNVAANLCHEAIEILRDTLSRDIVVKRDKEAFKENVAKLKVVVAEMEKL